MSLLSSSLKVIGTDTDRSATYDFLLVFHSKYGPIFYCFQDKRRFLFENRKFFPPRVFNTPAEGVPWNFVTAVGVEKTRVVSLPDGGKSLAICAFISIQYQSVADRQTNIYAVISRSSCTDIC